MAVLYINEFSVTGGRSNFDIQGALVAPIVSQTVAITAGSVASAAFNTNTNFVRVNTDAVCSVAFGSAPTATAAKMRLAQNQTEYFSVNPGDKVAVITNS